MIADASLVAMGWDDDASARWHRACGGDLIPARTVQTDRGMVWVWTGVVHGSPVTVRAVTTKAARATVAGDWVGLHAGASRVERIVPRSSGFVRRAARGAMRPQTLAANIDVVVVTQALATGLNPRRLERELVLAHQSGARPLVVLTKADLVDPGHAEEQRVAAATLAPDVEVLVTSAVTGQGLDALRAGLAPGRVFALVGSSGVGKSALVNALAGEAVQALGPVRAGDQKGRHTTTAARLIHLEGDRLLIDTPGVRALALWEGTDGLGAVFPEIDELARRCHFDDCSHHDEPDSAVRAAVTAGRLDPGRLANWQRMHAELGDVDDLLVAREWGAGTRSRPAR